LRVLGLPRVPGLLRASGGVISGREVSLLLQSLYHPGFGGESPFQPAFQATKQGADPGDSPTVELQRHPGAGCLVGSTAVYDQFSVAREFVMTFLEFVYREPVSAR